MKTLCTINFLLAITTTIIMTVSPFFITEGLGLSILAFSIIEGFTELISNSLRFISGRLFDTLKDKRKIFSAAVFCTVLGKLLFLVPSASSIFLSKTFERISNGLFASPRDAYVAVNATNKPIAMAILTCSKTLGCILGPFIVALYVYFNGDLMQHVSGIIYLTLFISIVSLYLCFFIDSKRFEVKTKELMNIKIFTELLTKLKPILLVCGLFYLARFNDGLISLYLKEQGLPSWFYLSTISFFNICMFVIAPIFGYMINKKHLITVIYITIISLILFNICAYFITESLELLAGLSLFFWGVQRVGSQTAFVIAIFNMNKRKDATYGSSIGIYSLLTGLTTFIASLLCGYITQYSMANIFLFSFVISVLSLLTFILQKKHFTA